jgi:hypothetical protein
VEKARDKGNGRDEEATKQVSLRSDHMLQHEEVEEQVEGQMERELTSTTPSD